MDSGAGASDPGRSWVPSSDELRDATRAVNDSSDELIRVFEEGIAELDRITRRLADLPEPTPQNAAEQRARLDSVERDYAGGAERRAEELDRVLDGMEGVWERFGRVVYAYYTRRSLATPEEREEAESSRDTSERTRSALARTAGTVARYRQLLASLRDVTTSDVRRAALDRLAAAYGRLSEQLELAEYEFGRAIGFLDDRLRAASRRP